MNRQERISLFNTQLDFIHSPPLRRFAENCLSLLPEYFFHIPAPSSGKYHPPYALGEGGLVRHTKAAIGIFRALCSASVDEYYMLRDVDIDDGCIDKEQLDDEIVVALLLHDGFKSGIQTEDSVAPPNGFTAFDHPLLASRFIFEQTAEQGLDMSVGIRIASIVASHMGKYNMSSRSSVILPTPDAYGWQAKLVHICDLLASRKYLHYIFAEGE